MEGCIMAMKRYHRSNSSIFWEYSLKRDVRQNGYPEELLHMTWEEIDNIPCVTDTKCNEYVKEGNQYVLKERTSK